MFELSVTLKYLLPRWRQLSVSIISLISIIVIALVVWLVVVFFSVTHGLEKTWIQKLVAVTAPIRLIPSPDYYRSYYYLVDGISEKSDFSLKNIAEKKASPYTDPYNLESDEELPAHWPLPDRQSNGLLKDLVKEAFSSIEHLQNSKGISAYDYEIAYAELSLQKQQTNIHQPVFISTLEPSNPALYQSLLATREDLSKINSNEGVLLPKLFRDMGVQLGDKGWLSYSAATASAVQEHRLPILVEGFYDPGILPMGGKFILAPRLITSTIRATQTAQEEYPTNGIGIAFDDLSQTDQIKQQLQDILKQKGIDGYWKVESFRDFAGTKDLLQQLQSERTLFSLIASIIIIVACSNIVSLLVILVNDKKEEIGILRAMGASVWSIAFIFGFCGTVMGTLGSLAGIGLALLTLSNLQPIINIISAFQGHELFNPLFYGDRLPTQLSNEALLFVLTVTAVISMIAGLIPAIKACLMQPSQLLRTE